MLARSSKAIICSPYIPSDKPPVRTRRTLVHPRRRLVLCSRGCIHALHRPPGWYTFDWSWLGSGANRLLPGPGTSSRRQRPARAPPCRTGASTSLAGNHTGSPWQGIRHSRAACPHCDVRNGNLFIWLPCTSRALGASRRPPASGCQPTFDLGIDAPATIRRFFTRTAGVDRAGTVRPRQVRRTGNRGAPAPAMKAAGLARKRRCGTPALRTRSFKTRSAESVAAVRVPVQGKVSVPAGRIIPIVGFCRGLVQVRQVRQLALRRRSPVFGFHRSIRAATKDL
jgi:hypothetical protein